jgi:hypothetical protein
MPLEAVLQVEAQLIRQQAPDLLLRGGQTLAASVGQRHGRHGILNLAGVPLLAELPDGVKTGDKLRLMVQDTRGEKVVMKLVQDQAVQTPPAQIGIPLPGGGHARVEVDPDSAAGAKDGDPENAAIALTYDSPELGTFELRITLAPGAVTVQAEVPGGRSHDLADDASDALRNRLAALTGRAAEVRVVPRRESIDAYA